MSERSRNNEPNAITLSGGLDPQLWDALDRLAMAHEGLSKQTVVEAAQAVYERWRELHVGRAPAEFLNEAIERARERSEAYESVLDQHLFPGMFDTKPMTLADVDRARDDLRDAPVPAFDASRYVQYLPPNDPRLKCTCPEYFAMPLGIPEEHEPGCPRRLAGLGGR